MFNNLLEFNQLYKNFSVFKNIHKNKKIFFFTVNYDWLKFCLYCASIMAIRGCKSTVTFNKKWDFNNVPQNMVNETYNKYIKPLNENTFGEDVKIFEIKESNSKKVLPTEIIIKIREQINADLTHKYHLVDLTKLKNYKKIFLNTEKFYQNLASSILDFLKVNYYDHYIIPVGTNFGWAVCRIVLEHLKLEYISTEGSVTFQDNKFLTCENYPVVMFNTHVVSKDWKKYKANIKKLNFKKIKKQNLKYLKEIYNPKNYVSFQSSEKIIFKKRKDIILLLPSFHHEQHYRYEHYCFKSMNEWLFSTLDYFHKNKKFLEKYDIIVRFHPLAVYAEGKNIDLEDMGSSEEYAFNIFKNKDENFKNLFHYIPPDQLENSNTLELIKISDLIITYQSMCGLEASLINKQVINLAGTAWSKKKFLHEPKSKLEYYKMIEKFFNNKLLILDNQEAHYFFDFYCNYFHKDFVWNMMWGGEFFKNNEIQDVICLPFTLNNYFRNFDYLIGDNPQKYDEFNIIKKEVDKNLKEKNFKLAKKLIGFNKIFYLNYKILIKNKKKILLISYLYFKFYIYKFLYSA